MAKKNCGKDSAPPFNVACSFPKITAIAAQHCLEGGGGVGEGADGQDKRVKDHSDEIGGLKR